MAGKWLKIGRVALAVLCVALLTFAIVAEGSVLAPAGRWIAHVQIFEAALSCAFGWVVLWLLVTFVFGRVYCSTVCPMGALMDVLSRLAGRGKAGREYHYQPPSGKTRIVILVLTVIAVLAGAELLYLLVAPGTAYHRIAQNVGVPVVDAVGNVVAGVGEATGWWELPTVKILVASSSGLVIAVLTLAVVIWFANKSGRSLCNTVCPVGTLLGVVSRHSMFHFDIDTDLCTQCRACEHVCKASCIDLVDHVVDDSRCVGCFNCVNMCPNNAMRYTTDRKQLSIPMMQRASRRVTAPTAMNVQQGDNLTNPKKENHNITQQ